MTKQNYLLYVRDAKQKAETGLEASTGPEARAIYSAIVLYAAAEDAAIQKSEHQGDWADRAKRFSSVIDELTAILP